MSNVKDEKTTLIAGQHGNVKSSCCHVVLQLVFLTMATVSLIGVVFLYKTEQNDQDHLSFEFISFVFCIIALVISVVCFLTFCIPRFTCF